MDIQSIAPAMMVRACAFPIEVLAAFGDSRLAEKAANVDAHDVTDFKEAYAHAIAREREALWRETIGSPRFLKALMLTNPGFAERAQRVDLGVPPRRHERRLDTTLYRYLARAVGRTEPCDLWAGVTWARWGERTRTIGVPAKYAIAPDLRPFRYLVRELARRAPYCAKSRYRANPTLVRQQECGWTYWGRVGSGPLKQRRLDGGPAFDLVLERMLALPPLTPKEIAAEVGIEFDSLRTAFDTLVAGGAMVGGLDLPSSFETAWDALDEVEHQLESDDCMAWHSRVATLRGLCVELEHRFDDIDIAPFGRLVTGAASCVKELGHDLGIELPADAPRAALRCDLRMPFEIEFGPEIQRLIPTAIAYYDRFLATWSPANLYRQAKRDHLAIELPGEILLANIPMDEFAVSVPKTWQTLAAGIPFGVDLMARIADWERMLQAVADSVVCPDLGPDSVLADRPFRTPLACLLAGLSRRPDGLQLRIRGSLDDVTPLYARFTILLGDRAADAGLLAWTRAAYGRLGNSLGSDIAELKGLVESQPNVSAGPSFAPLAIELWGATPGWPSLVGARLATKDGIMRLQLENRSRPLLVFGCTGANLSHGDPFAQFLLLTSFRDAPTIKFQASNLPFESELAQPRFAPRVALLDGSVVRTRRTVLTGEPLNELIGGRSASRRFATWQQLARRHSWPALLTVRLDNDASLVVPRDSPLALEAAFAGDLAGTRMIVVEEFDSSPWLEAPDGQHYTAEIAIPYERQNNVRAASGGGAP